jgi:hypothetical protein
VTIPTSSRTQRGSALLCTLVLVVSCAALAAAMIRKNIATKLEYDARWASAQRLYLARAGISNAFLRIRAGTSAVLGSAASPLACGDGAYYVESVKNADDSYTLTAHGRFGGSWASVRSVARDVAVPVFDHALYAGNSSQDPNYTLTFGGTGTQADQVAGDVYSGGNLTVAGDAHATGTLRASGTITGGTGTTGIVQPGPTLADQLYETNNGCDVAAQFASVTVKTYNALGGDAYQVPATNLAHIFRKNPTDRMTEYQGTAKNDYFLEDPYQTMSTSQIPDAAHSSPIALSSGATSGNKIVYYIDGNMWVHNRNIMSFKLTHPDSTGVQVTFVVRGNVYISDNIIRENPALDGVAIIALKDSAVEDSGNIYFGDTSYGTLEQMDAFMYAENNFLDTNLSASGSSHITVNGTMSAGNQIRIQRDYGGSHTRMDLNFDDRVENDTITLPGMPPLLGGHNKHDWRLASMIAIGH